MTSFGRIQTYHSRLGLQGEPVNTLIEAGRAAASHAGLVDEPEVIRAAAEEIVSIGETSPL